jgi:HemX protein
MIGILHIGSFALYGVAGSLLAISFAREARRLPAIASAVVALGLVLHGAALADYSSRWSQLPLEGLGPSLSTLAFLTGLGCIIAATLGHAATVGLVLVPVVALLTGVAAIVGVTPAQTGIDFRGGWFVLHVLFAFIGLAGLAMAFAAGLMYLLQFRELKSKHFGAIFRFFPPLDTLDRLGRLGLFVGFPFLTLSLLLGWAWTINYSEAALASHKLVWVLVSWLVFPAALLARTGHGRRGERGALVSVVGFVLVVVVYVIVRAQSTQNGSFL